MGGFHAEIMAFASLTDARPDPWEVGMLRLIYRVHMASLDKKSKAKASEQPRSEVSASDGAGVAGFLRGLGAKKAG